MTKISPIEEAISEKKQVNEDAVRQIKVKKLYEKHIDPWPNFKPITSTCKKVITEFQENEESKRYAVAGRVMAIRLHGKTAFAHIQDRSGRLQIYLKTEILGVEKFNFFNDYIDRGDIVWCEGTSFRTKMGDITLSVSDIVLLSKSLHSLPEKFHGLTDIEIKYRQRYLDLIINEETRQRFVKRSAILRLIRRYLDEHDFLEVETPMLHPIPGGAAARPFITHHNALDVDLYLRIAPELYLKRLVIGGFERVYEINRNFRNEGVSTRHNPEFTMVEFYMAYEDYHFIMNFVENLIRKVVHEITGSLQVSFGSYKLDFEPAFKRMNAAEALIMYGNLCKEELYAENIDETFNKHAIKVPEGEVSYGKKLFILFEALAESKIVQPTFIIDFPIEISPLAKRDPDNHQNAARFELFIASMEISNGFNELNDPFDQATRFREQAKAHESGDEEAHYYDASYITALEYGLPPTAGVGIGIDRLVMLLTNATSIKDVILFPTLRAQTKDE
jgi:lysyl-tRNA synthetase, class II